MKRKVSHSVASIIKRMKYLKVSWIIWCKFRRTVKVKINKNKKKSKKGAHKYSLFRPPFFVVSFVSVHHRRSFFLWLLSYLSPFISPSVFQLFLSLLISLSKNSLSYFSLCILFYFYSYFEEQKIDQICRGYDWWNW